MKNLLNDISKSNAKSGLKKAPKKELTKEEKQKAKEAEKIRDVTGIKTEQDRRKYYFESGIDTWYEDLKDHTFPTTLIPLNRKEGQAIINIFNGVEVEPSLEVLKPLEEKLDEAIEENHTSSAFIKLSTRSPKDSSAAFKKAGDTFKALDKTKFDYNQRWVSLYEELRQSFKVTKGSEAIELVITSQRVVEDLEFALDESKDILVVSLVVRSFDEDVLPETEFRGFVWNSKLTCVSQSLYKLYFESVQGREKDISNDLLKFFETINAKMKSPCYIIDLVWFADGRDPLLIEVNPFDGEVLGSFPSSTGLFNWEKDREVMSGKKDFELRICKEKPTEEDMAGLNAAWNELVKS